MRVCPRGPTLQAEEEEKLSLAQIRDHIFLILKVKGIFPTIHAQKGFSKVRMVVGGGRHPVTGDVNLPIGRFARIHLGYEMHMHKGKNP